MLLLVRNFRVYTSWQTWWPGPTACISPLQPGSESICIMCDEKFCSCHVHFKTKAAENIWTSKHSSESWSYYLANDVKIRH